MTEEEYLFCVAVLEGFFFTVEVKLTTNFLFQLAALLWLLLPPQQPALFITVKPLNQPCWTCINSNETFSKLELKLARQVVVALYSSKNGAIDCAESLYSESFQQKIQQNHTNISHPAALPVRKPCSRVFLPVMWRWILGKMFLCELPQCSDRQPSCVTSTQTYEEGSDTLTFRNRNEQRFVFIWKYKTTERQGDPSR